MTKSVLPESVRMLPLAEKLQRLKLLSEEDYAAFDVLVTSTLERCWQEHFHAGPRGGLKLAPSTKEGA